MMRCSPVFWGVLACGPATALDQYCEGPKSCNLFNEAKVIFAGTAIEHNKDTGKTRFRVTESFKGAHRVYVDLTEVPPDTLGFAVGGEYLVFADRCFWEPASTGCLYARPCSYTRRLENATAILEQLRAKKDGKKVAAVYGTLMLWPNAALGALGDDESRPLPNVLVRLQSGGKSFETKTDKLGVYAFDQLPPGDYQLSLNLPPDLTLGGLPGHNLVTSFELPRGTCFEKDVYAQPTGQISGRVIGPDGSPLPVAAVYLYPASRYEEGKEGVRDWQGKGPPMNGWDSFEFNHLPAGDYLLVFGSANEEDPDVPFPMTFYPNATKLERAQRIHLSAGQQIQNADIRVSNPLPTRQITVRLDWAGRKPEAYSEPGLLAIASRGRNKSPVKKDRDTYIFTLFPDARYTISAWAICARGIGAGKAKATGEVTVDAGNPSLSEITLRFDSGPGACE